MTKIDSEIYPEAAMGGDNHTVPKRETIPPSSDDIFNFERLRISQNFEKSVGARKLLVTVRSVSPTDIGSYGSNPITTFQPLFWNCATNAKPTW